ncbi:hypothetical protein BDR03DRAFT_943747 [Suillus americanus]|nr:hypothetical protein BDR03DRAFT_943747 [Suillus americanus]
MTISRFVVYLKQRGATQFRDPSSRRGRHGIEGVISKKQCFTMDSRAEGVPSFLEILALLCSINSKVFKVISSTVLSAIFNSVGICRMIGVSETKSGCFFFRLHVEGIQNMIYTKRIHDVLQQHIHIVTRIEDLEQILPKQECRLSIGMYLLHLLTSSEEQMGRIDQWYYGSKDLHDEVRRLGPQWKVWPIGSIIDEFILQTGTCHNPHSPL